MDRTHVGSARRVVLPAMLAALSLLILYGSALSPTGRMGLVAVAGLMPAAAVVSGGLGAGLMCYAGTGLLALMLLPAKDNALLYLLFFGIYPMVKYGVEAWRKQPVELFCKLVFFNAMFSLFWFGLRTVFLSALPVPETALWLLYLAGNGVFLVYDFGFSKLIAFYIQRVDKPLRK